MKESFIQPKPLSSLGSKILLFNENKLKNLENRLMGPNSEGKAPSESQPLKESELENIKTKILLNAPLAPKEIKENINTINENKKNKNNISSKINTGLKNSINNESKNNEKFLKKKRYIEEKNNKIELNNDLCNFDKNDSNKSSLSLKSNKSDNSSC